VREETVKQGELINIKEQVMVSEKRQVDSGYEESEGVVEMVATDKKVRDE
jgi:hypothetical protein